MKVSGFTFIRNAIKLDYPIVEAIQSILPLCDEVIVAVARIFQSVLFVSRIFSSWEYQRFAALLYKSFRIGEYFNHMNSIQDDIKICANT